MSAVARRYARALLDLCPSEAEAQAVREALAAARVLLSEHSDLGRTLSHPAVAADSRKKIAERVWARPGEQPLVGRLLTLLAERGRMPLLPAIEGAFQALWNERRNVVAAETVTAVPLEASQHTALAAALGDKVGKKVEVTTRVDPALMGGVLVRMGGKTFDGSVRARLKALRHRIAAGA